MNGKQISSATVLLLAGSGPAVAATGPSGDVMGIAGWVFCGYCALIVVAQTLKAIRRLLELSRVKPAQPAAEKVAP